jgi:hypothetical protein
MIKLIVVTICVVLLSASCKQKENNKTLKPATAQSKDSSTSFPIMEMLKEDVKEVQKIPYFIYKKTTSVIDNKFIDSFAVSTEQFAQLIAPLLQIDIASNTVKDKFKEVAFHDLSTQSISIVTSSIDGTTEVRSVTTLLDDETNKLKSFFAMVESNLRDTLKRTNFYWKAGKSLTISKSIQLKGKTLKETKEFINWNDISQ